MQTEIGRIATMLQGAETLAPLQQRMAAFGQKLTLLVFFYALYFCCRLVTKRGCDLTGTDQYFAGSSGYTGSITCCNYHFFGGGYKKNVPLKWASQNTTGCRDIALRNLHMHG